MQTLQRNLRYPPMASNFRYIQDKKCDEDDYILTYQDKEGEWLIAGDIPWQFKTGFREGTEAAPRKKVAAASA
ncbi:hypothetical protein E1A91_A13G116900v1 [Gossypium mustelinum]|uniref:Auxin-responsive protein n=1 Tax=Gossypium mustelinum TaxID=34275 RepID=A0A5D2WIW0_GOSMU|nr:hypothetical protein E1A91_A13G116900v1 [Gossypium mustelinum]